jgi:HPr kinase/phosphorylase
MMWRGNLHASAVCRQGAGVLLLGPSGAGKSDLALRLIQAGFVLVADDRVCVDGLVASPPEALAGLLEVRGLGLMRLPFTTASLVLAVALAAGPLPAEMRLPAPENFPDLDIPLIRVDAGAASAAMRVALALDCLLGQVPMEAGAFA